MSADAPTDSALRADDIEVSETNQTQIGHSLQRNEDGTWRDAGQNTSGLSNDAQPEFNVRLNEFHYDNASTDENEFIEVRADIDLPLNYHPFLTRALLFDTPFGVV